VQRESAVGPQEELAGGAVGEPASMARCEQGVVVTEQDLSAERLRGGPMLLDVCTSPVASRHARPDHGMRRRPRRELAAAALVGFGLRRTHWGAIQHRCNHVLHWPSRRDFDDGRSR
jgi:hypothetical protein